MNRVATYLPTYLPTYNVSKFCGKFKIFHLEEANLSHFYDKWGVRQILFTSLAIWFLKGVFQQEDIMDKTTTAVVRNANVVA